VTRVGSLFALLMLFSATSLAGDSKFLLNFDLNIKRPARLSTARASASRTTSLRFLMWTVAAGSCLSISDRLEASWPLKHQLVVLNRGRGRAPNLRPIDRVIAGLCTRFIRPYRLLGVAGVLRPSTLLAFQLQGVLQ